MGRSIGIKRTASLVKKLLRKNNKQRVDYLKLINPKEINLLSEITLNIVKGNVSIANRTIKLY